MFILSLPVLKLVSKHCGKGNNKNDTLQKYLRLYIMLFFSFISAVTLNIPDLHAKMTEWHCSLKSAKLLPVDIFIDFTNLKLILCDEPQIMDLNDVEGNVEINFFSSDILKLLLRCDRLQKDSFEITKVWHTIIFVTTCFSTKFFISYFFVKI